MSEDNTLTLEDVVQLIRVIPLDRWDEKRKKDDYDVHSGRSKYYETYTAYVGSLHLALIRTNASSNPKPTFQISARNYGSDASFYYNGQEHAEVFNELDRRFQEHYKLESKQAESFLRNAGCPEPLLQKVFAKKAKEEGK